VQYYDVSLPEEAKAIIRESLWVVPRDIAAKVRGQYPNVSAQQVYRAWAEFSQILWRRSDNQLESAKTLLTEMDLQQEVDIFEVGLVDGVTALAWGLKKVAHRLKGQIVEVAIDATCESLFIYLLCNLLIRLYFR